MISMQPRISATRYAKVPLRDSVKSGALSGLVGAWAIFGMILAVGGQLGLSPGIFYHVVGLSMGVSEEWPAIYFGFLLHMITGAIIGIVYLVLSDNIKILRLTSTIKAFGTGVATGIGVWVVLFMPLHFFVVQPALENQLIITESGSQLYLAFEKLILVSDSVLYGALGIHIAFGGVLGFIARVATSAREPVDRESHE